MAGFFILGVPLLLLWLVGTPMLSAMVDQVYGERLHDTYNGFRRGLYNWNYERLERKDKIAKGRDREYKERKSGW